MIGKSMEQRIASYSNDSLESAPIDKQCDSVLQNDSTAVGYQKDIIRFLD